MPAEMSVTIRVNDAATQLYPLQKITGNMPLTAMIDLINHVDLDANPRLAKTGRVTQDIEESLENQSDIFHFMSKGILIAASKVEPLDRSRFRLFFDDPELEGILDGGHNTLAAGRHILRQVLTEELGATKAEIQMKKVRTWEGLKEQWITHQGLLTKHRSKVSTALMPIEVIYPGEGPTAYADFQDKVLVINAARNNNAELTAETKDSKLGYYDEIRSSIDPKLSSDVEWKLNDGGRVKVRDLLALALIPLSVLDFRSVNSVVSNPSLLFASKGQCVKIYSSLLNEESVTTDKKGNIVQIVDPSVKSALSLMKDMPRLFDKMYELMPLAYNSNGGKFGNLNGVEIGLPGKEPLTRYYKRPVRYSYGEGFIYPLMYALRALIQEENGIVSWIEPPDQFIDKHLANVMKTFYSMMHGQNFDPAKVGKASGAYHLAYDMFSAALNAQFIQKLKSGK
ncbi:hypothetical protein ACSC9T_06480 [Pseudomonas putida]|uniref:hypothetical protein n=1 Tax=Pseudomonas putida TaxID=303 RepID=UPI003F4AC529